MKRFLLPHIGSAIWSSLSQLSRTAVSLKLIQPVKLNARVISVGNIQAGGAGKTPLVAKIAREGIERKLKVCILTRGYKSQWEYQGGRILPSDQKVRAELCGDEAALLHDLCPQAWIGVGADRLKSYHGMIQDLNCQFELVILDDGFQNRKIHKDIEILAMTSNPWGSRYFRDFPGTIRFADLVVWTKGKNRPASENQPLVHVEYRLPRYEGSKSIWLITGVGDGDSAYQLAIQSGYPVMKHIQCSDHARYLQKEVNDWLDQAESAGCTIAVTGKDWVKWRDLGVLGVSQSKIIVLEPVLEIVEGKDQWLKTLWGE